MADMYKKLTSFLPAIEVDSFGEWIIDRENDGTPEHPMHFPFVSYSDMVNKLTDEIYNFEREHQEYGLNRYGEILEENCIKWGSDSMSAVDVSKMNGRVVMGILMGAVRAERFCDGAFLGFLKDGSIKRWLERLQELDREQ